MYETTTWESFFDRSVDPVFPPWGWVMIWKIYNSVDRLTLRTKTICKKLLVKILRNYVEFTHLQSKENILINLGLYLENSKFFFFLLGFSGSPFYIIVDKVLGFLMNFSFG